jgi:hypothetical protein
MKGGIYSRKSGAILGERAFSFLPKVAKLHPVKVPRAFPALPFHYS